MRLLLITYEFPPSPSPGSLRWQYLSRELALNGFRVDVLAPGCAGSLPALDELPPQVKVHRVFPGLLGKLVAGRTSARRAVRPTPNEPNTGLNWKGKSAHRLKEAIGFFMYPDIRAEWKPWAGRALDRMLKRECPDLVISAHEPATSLQLGLAAARRGIPWIADLGDPVLAPYTPRRWQQRATRLEAAVCEHAQHVILTTEAARRTLIERHGAAPEKMSVMTQGFEDRTALCSADEAGISFDRDRLELVYVGRFYPFRRPHELMAAVCEASGVRLTIASPELPSECSGIVAASDGKIRYLGAVPHAQALVLQRHADVLVSIGNDGMDAQVPGKLYEYLGSSRPILHLLAYGVADPAADLIRDLGVGRLCVNRKQELLSVMQAWKVNKLDPMDPQFGRGDSAALQEYGWSRIGARYSGLIADCIRNSVPSERSS